jgi:alkylation response protein AidB-like acyl-CoA dehydrogenase
VEHRQRPGLTDTAPCADLDRPIEMPRGDDLALGRGTDFFHVGEQLDEREREVLHRVREYCDTQVAPVANEYWERAEFPAPLVEGYRKLEVAGGTLSGYGCPGLSALAEGMVAAELARGDGSIATFPVACRSGSLTRTAGRGYGFPRRHAANTPHRVHIGIRRE